MERLNHVEIIIQPHGIPHGMCMQRKMKERRGMAEWVYKLQIYCVHTKHSVNGINCQSRIMGLLSSWLSHGNSTSIKYTIHITQCTTYQEWISIIHSNYAYIYEYFMHTPENKSIQININLLIFYNYQVMLQ